MSLSPSVRSFGRVVAPLLGDLYKRICTDTALQHQRVLTSLTSLTTSINEEGFAHAKTRFGTQQGGASLLHQCASRVRQQSRTFAQEASAVDITLTDAAIQRLKDLVAEEPGGSRMALRITVEAGGCSGFSYKFDLDPDHNVKEGDHVFDYSGATLVVDDVSLEFLRGATVDFADELIKSTFEVVSNPNASGKCGCGSSFTPKDM